jgi:hypothetical protein
MVLVIVQWGIKFLRVLLLNRGSVAGETGYGLDDPGIGVRVPVG